MTDNTPAPDFRCPKGHPLYVSVESERELEPFEPTPCWACKAIEARREASKRRKLGHVVAGVDVRKAFALYRAKPPFVGNLGRHVKLTVGHRAESRWSGHAKTYSRSIRVAYGPSATAADVLEILAHEMCHLACPKREGHGERFRLTLRRAARELWGIEAPLLAGKNRGVEVNAAYAMDRLILKELNAKLERGELDLTPFAPDAPAPKAVDLSRRRAALVEKRAAHAARMLARAEKRTKAAQRSLTKWRTKVRYYEKVAAKRGGS